MFDEASLEREEAKLAEMVRNISLAFAIGNKSPNSTFMIRLSLCLRPDLFSCRYCPHFFLHVIVAAMCFIFLHFILLKEVAVVNTEPMGFMKNSRPDNSEPKSDDDEDDDNDSDTFGTLFHVLRGRICTTCTKLCSCM